MSPETTGEPAEVTQPAHLSMTQRHPARGRRRGWGLGLGTCKGPSRFPGEITKTSAGSGQEVQRGKCLPGDGWGGTGTFHNPGPGRLTGEQGVNCKKDQGERTSLGAWELSALQSQAKVELKINCITIKNLCLGKSLDRLCFCSNPAFANHGAAKG